jgi:hypothetical protein
MSVRHRVIGCALLCLAIAPCHAEVYRWVDEQGQVHFDDQPPDSSTRSFKPASPSGQGGGEDQRMEKTRKLLNAYESERQQAREQAAERRENEEKRRRQCVEAKDDLRQYQEAGSLYRLDEEGKRVWYSNAEREALIAQYREAIAKWCR